MSNERTRAQRNFDNFALYNPVHLLAAGLYRIGRYNIHTSSSPTVYHDKGWLERVLQPESKFKTTVSLPLEIDDRTYRAAKGEIHHLGDYNLWRNYPAVLLELADPHPETIGDESITLRPRKDAQKYFNAKDSDVIYLVWHPGQLTIDVGTPVAKGIKAVHYKMNADLTLQEIAQEMSRQLLEKSNSRVKVHPEHIMDGIIKVSKKSKGLQARLELLKERAVIQRALMTHPEAVASATGSMLNIPNEAKLKMLEDFRSGEVTTFGQLNQYLDKMEGVTIGGGVGVIALAERMGLQTVLLKNLFSELDGAPPSFLLAGLNLPVISAYIDVRVNQTEPMVRAMAREQALFGALTAEYYKEMAINRNAMIKAAIEEAKKARTKFEAEGRKAAAQYVQKAIESASAMLFLPEEEIKNKIK